MDVPRPVLSNLDFDVQTVILLVHQNVGRSVEMGLTMDFGNVTIATLLLGTAVMRTVE